MNNSRSDHTFLNLHPAMLRAYASGPSASPEVVARVNGSTIEAALRFIEWCRTDHEHDPDGPYDTLEEAS